MLKLEPSDALPASLPATFKVVPVAQNKAKIMMCMRLIEGLLNTSHSSRCLPCSR
jgi:hypothetical protein